MLLQKSAVRERAPIRLQHKLHDSAAEKNVDAGGQIGLVEDFIDFPVQTAFSILYFP